MSSAAWSSYKPTGGETYPRAQKLANFVAPRYISGGSPIAVIQAQPLFFHDQVVDGVAFTRAPFQDVGEHYHQLEPAGASTMAYVFCGQAERCGLAATGAEDVIPLLRRESLELALYTFKYWPDIDAVVAILPPATKSKPAVYFKRSNLEAELSKPLERTLPSRDAHHRLVDDPAELAAVDRLTPPEFTRRASRKQQAGECSFSDGYPVARRGIADAVSRIWNEGFQRQTKGGHMTGLSFGSGSHVRHRPQARIVDFE